MAPKQKTKTMKIISKLLLATVLFACGLAAKADWVSGYTRTNGTYVAPYYRSSPGLGTYPSDSTVYRPTTLSYHGSSSSHAYVYRNPYAAYPSVSVHGYYRSSGTYVAPHRRTPPNSTLTDNLSYRGYGAIRVPRDR
jgi:hypothetical protein